MYASRIKERISSILGAIFSFSVTFRYGSKSTCTVSTDFWTPFSGKFASPSRSLILYFPWKMVTRNSPSSTSPTCSPSTPASLPPSVRSSTVSSRGRSIQVDMQRSTNAADFFLLMSLPTGSQSGWSSTIPVTRWSMILALIFILLLKNPKSEHSSAN